MPLKVTHLILIIVSVILFIFVITSAFRNSNSISKTDCDCSKECKQKDDKIPASKPRCPELRCPEVRCPKVSCPKVSCPKVRCPIVDTSETNSLRTTNRLSNNSNNFTNLGLLVRDHNNEKQYAQLFGKKTKQNSERWQYYAQLENNTGTKVPVLKKGENCYTGGWPWCSLLYTGDMVSLSGETNDTWKVEELWPISCDWQGNSLACKRQTL